MDYFKQLWVSSLAVRVVTCGCVVALAVAMATAEPGDFPDSARQNAQPSALERVKGWLPWTAKPPGADRMERLGDRVFDKVERGADLAEQVFDRVEGKLKPQSADPQQVPPSSR